MWLPFLLSVVSVAAHGGAHLENGNPKRYQHSTPLDPSLLLEWSFFSFLFSSHRNFIIGLD
jgi:hypothetical protein